MAVPKDCKVLVIGGGPSGSFASSVLAREGYDVVLLEMDTFPRYHVGESMLPSMRQFLQLIGAYDKFNDYGFVKKNGAAFRLNHAAPAAYTDFLDAGGPQGYAWNIVRSEADNLLLRHAEECGVKVFERTKVDSIQFESSGNDEKMAVSGAPSPGRPVSAKWSRKDGASGEISFSYLVDASGRQGLVSTKYFKNRKVNQTLKNIANWGYWKGGETYCAGTERENVPYFEALTDGSGWCWYIPLHDGTHSVGIVQNQAMATAKKKEQGSPSTKEFYQNSLDIVPGIKELLSKGEIVSEIKAASDWSYSASSYASPYIRLSGDAGCFIDPFFSSGVHLAMLSGLSAAVTIAASIKGHCKESTAASWHSKKVAESYTRFLLVVSSALKQIRSQETPIIQDVDEEGFQRAFDIFRPIIQGTADAANNATNGTGHASADVSQTMDFCFRAFTHINPVHHDSLLEKLKEMKANSTATSDVLSEDVTAEMEKQLTGEELQVLDVLRSRRLIREDVYGMDGFGDTIDGLAPTTTRGKIGLMNAEATKLATAKMYSADFLIGHGSGMRARQDIAIADGQ